MKVLYSIFMPGFALTAVLLMSAATLHAQNAPSAKDMKAAEQIFQGKCALCHGQDGSGNSITGKQLGAKDLKSDEVQKLSDEELVTAIAKGKNKMPAFGGKLSDAQIKSMVAEIRHLAGK